MSHRPGTAASRTLLTALALALLVPACAARTDAVDPTLAPLVPVESLPRETVAATSTTVGRAEPAPPLISALPESDCALTPVAAGGEITFVSGDRLYTTTPDGAVVSCLTTVTGDQRGVVQWSPLGDKVLLHAATVLDADGARSSGYNIDNVRVVWEYPTGAAMLGPTATSRTLVRRTADANRTRSEVTFLGRTDLVVSHPAGGLIFGAGQAWNGVEGLFAADGSGDPPRPLVVFDDTDDRIVELAADADGASLLFVAVHGDSSRLYRFDLTDRKLTELTTAQEPILQLVTGPVADSVAWNVGLCNSTTQTQAFDTRDGSVVVVGVGTQLEGQSVAPVGWLDSARLVVVSRPIGCDGPGNLWVWNLLDGSATLLTTTVEFPATRTTATPAAPAVLDPVLAPVHL